MTWWAWILLWVVLVAGAGLVLYIAVRRLLRQGMALARELGTAADLLADVTRTFEAAAPDVTAVQSPAARDRPRPAPGASSHRRPGGSDWQDVR